MNSPNSPGGPAPRRIFQNNLAAQTAFLASLGVDVTGIAYARRLSLCCDQAAPLASLFEQLQAAATPTIVLAPDGVAHVALAAFLQVPVVAGARATLGGLTVQVIPALEAARYERLLWACDVNFVFGAEARLRAHAAGRPCICQVAMPERGALPAHVDADLANYWAGLEPRAAAMLRAATLVWNGVGTDIGAVTACLAGPVQRALTLHSQAYANN